MNDTPEISINTNQKFRKHKLDKLRHKKTSFFNEVFSIYSIGFILKVSIKAVV